MIARSPQSVYRSRPIKRRRRSKAEIKSLRATIYDTLEADHPMTVRQVFYWLVSDGVIEKTEAEYKTTICRLLTVMRRERVLPFDWLADSTRWMRKPTTYSGLERCLKITAQTYRRSLWDDQDARVEIWLEKDALAGVLYQETQEWDVPLMVTRGYPSLSFLHGAAMEIEASDKPTHLYYFGDHDPSGVDIPRKVEEDIRDFAPEVELSFERVAVLSDQIEKWKLPTRPTKKTDSRSKTFQGESVEVDAIPLIKLRELVRDCIERHIDPYQLAETQRIEELERASLLSLAYPDEDEDE